MPFSKLQPRKEILGLPLNNENVFDSLTQWFPDPDLCQEDANHVRAATGEWHDVRPRGRDGRVLDVSCADIRLSDDTSICVAQYITTRKEAQRRVEPSERRFRALFEKTSEHISVVDPNGRVLHASAPSTEQRFGYTSEDLIGQCGFDFMHPDDLPRIREALTLLIWSGWL